MEMESDAILNIHPLLGAARILHLKKQEKLIDSIIHVAEWIKSNNIPMCEIHSFNQSIVQLLLMLTAEFHIDKRGELHVNIPPLHEHR